MRYVYLGDRMTAARYRDQPCDPIMDGQGKCVVSRGRALVAFANGERVVVLRRRLRLAVKDG